MNRESALLKGREIGEVVDNGVNIGNLSNIVLGEFKWPYSAVVVKEGLSIFHNGFMCQGVGAACKGLKFEFGFLEHFFSSINSP